jgi:arylsulfatase A-like enzyme
MSRAGATRPLPEPTPWALFGVALAALALVWLPLTVLQMIDGLLFLRRAADVARDVALAWPLVALPAAAFALIAWLAGRAARAVAATARHAALIAWALLLAPVAWICGWQLARTAWLWIKVTAGSTLGMSAETRLLAVALLAFALVLLFSLRAHRLLNAAVHHLLALRIPALVVVLLSLAVTLAAPPERLGARATPVAALPAGERAPDIILISIDTVAAEDAGACGGPLNFMPELRRFAAGATCFDRHYAAANFTTPTASTIETGTLPWSHLAVQPDAKVLPGLVRPALADALAARGYRAVSVTDNLLASPRHRGTHRGWQQTVLSRTTLFGNHVREAMTVFPDTALPQIAAAAWSFAGAFDVWLHGEASPYDSERVYDDARAVLAAQPPGQPLLLWVHTLPPHSPYLPPPSTKGRLLPHGELDRWHELLPDNVRYPGTQQPLADKHRLRYRESMLAADTSLGRFLAELQTSGRLARSIVVVTADHGESFERGFIGHAGPLLHESLVRIPFVLRLPGQTQGRVIEQPMSQADLAPTLLGLAGAAPLAHAEGRSWDAALRSGGSTLPDLMPVFTMSLEHQNRFAPLGAQGHFAVIDGRYKLWSTLGREPARLYDLTADPREANDIAATEPARVARLEALLRERLARAEAERSRRLTAAP